MKAFDVLVLHRKHSIVLYRVKNNVDKTSAGPTFGELLFSMQVSL